MKIINNRNNSEGQVVYLVVLALFGMAILATLGASLTKVLWSGFGILFLAVFIWSLVSRRYPRN